MNTLFVLMTVVSAFAVPVCLVLWLIKLVKKKPAKKMLKRALISAVCCVVFFVGFGLTMEKCEHEYELVESEAATCEEDGFEEYHCDLCGRDKTEKPKKLGHDMVDGVCTRCGHKENTELEKPTETEKPAETQKPTEGALMNNNDWQKSFEDAGFSSEEIEKYRVIIETVGIAEFHDVEIIENGIMHIVRGKIYDSSNLQLNVTLENREIIYIELAGIPDVKNVPYINWRGKLKNKKVNSKTSVELYSDTEGGYEGVLVWEDKFIYPCDENGVILDN